MSAALQFTASTALTPAQYERSKTRQQRAEDIAYTVNHAISCGLTDVFIQGPISNWVTQQSIKDNWLGNFSRWANQFFEKHDHVHHHPEPVVTVTPPAPVPAAKTESYIARARNWLKGIWPKGKPDSKAARVEPIFRSPNPLDSLFDAPSPKPQNKPAPAEETGKYRLRGHVHGPDCGHEMAGSFTGAGNGGGTSGSAGSVPHAHPHQHGLRDWMVGEAFGDFAAVPLTIVTQRYFPGFMHGIRRILEPLAGWAFRAGAERDARAWARQHSFAIDGPEAAAKAHDLYEHELSHLPQAVMWNVFSIPTNLMVQKHIMKSAYTWPELLIGKTFGSLVSNGMLIGSRAVSPDTLHSVDRWNSKHIIVPAAKKIGSVLGYDTKTMEDAANSVHNRRAAPSRDWVERVQRDAADKAIG